jgi:hypothetical protein
VLPSVSFEDSLKAEEFSPDPGSFVFGSADFGVIHLEAAELEERLCLFFPEVLGSKPFQHFYRKAREGRAVHLDGGSYVDSVAVMRVDTAGVSTHFPLSSVSFCVRAGGTLEPKGV